MAEDVRRAAAEYLAEMCHELAQLAAQNDLKLGCHLLEMAKLEFLEQYKCLAPCNSDERES